MIMDHELGRKWKKEVLFTLFGLRGMLQAKMAGLPAEIRTLINTVARYTGESGSV
jgi:hypothetical protein